MDRLEVLTNQETFCDAKRTYSDGVGAAAGTKSRGCTATITLPRSKNRPKQMELSFHIFHDSSVENTVIAYRLQVLPIFVKFNANEERAIPIDDETEYGLADWIDEKLVGFVETYFDVYFHPEYRKPHLVIDPVMGTSFPKYMSVETRELRGPTLHFLTDESFRKFSENAWYYLGVNFDPLVTEFFPSFDSFRTE